MRRLLPFAGLALLFLSACTTASLEELRAADPKGNAFQKALAKEYLAFADAEAGEYDWVDSKYFADKGLLAAYGNDVAPEDPANWNISADKRDPLIEAHKALVAALTAQATEAKPDVAARAQYGFDCWVEQSEEGWEQNEIDRCRNIYETAIQDLAGPAPMAAAKPKSESTVASYIVFFEPASAVLTTKAQQVLMTAMAEDAQHPDAMYTVNGHTDRAGEEIKNQELSEKRAMAVRDFLIAQGINPERIEYFAFGETDPLLPTADGVAEPSNRRVEIFLE